MSFIRRITTGKTLLNVYITVSLFIFLYLSSYELVGVVGPKKLFNLMLYTVLQVARLKIANVMLIKSLFYVPIGYILATVFFKCFLRLQMRLWVFFLNVLRYFVNLLVFPNSVPKNNGTKCIFNRTNLRIPQNYLVDKYLISPVVFANLLLLLVNHFSSNLVAQNILGLIFCTIFSDVFTVIAETKVFHDAFYCLNLFLSFLQYQYLLSQFMSRLLILDLRLGVVTSNFISGFHLWRTLHSFGSRMRQTKVTNRYYKLLLFCFQLPQCIVFSICDIANVINTNNFKFLPNVAYVAFYFCFYLCIIIFYFYFRNAQTEVLEVRLRVCLLYVEYAIAVCDCTDLCYRMHLIPEMMRCTSITTPFSGSSTECWMFTSMNGTVCFSTLSQKRYEVKILFWFGDFCCPYWKVFIYNSCIFIYLYYLFRSYSFAETLRSKSFIIFVHLRMYFKRSKDLFYNRWPQNKYVIFRIKIKFKFKIRINKIFFKDAQFFVFNCVFNNCAFNLAFIVYSLFERTCKFKIGSLLFSLIRLRYLTLRMFKQLRDFQFICPQAVVEFKFTFAVYFIWQDFYYCCLTIALCLVFTYVYDVFCDLFRISFSFRFNFSCDVLLFNIWPDNPLLIISRGLYITFLQPVFRYCYFLFIYYKVMSSVILLSIFTSAILCKLVELEYRLFCAFIYVYFNASSILIKAKSGNIILLLLFTFMFFGYTTLFYRIGSCGIFRTRRSNSNPKNTTKILRGF